MNENPDIFERQLQAAKLRAEQRVLLAKSVPEFDHFNYQEILDWAAENAEAKVEWINTFHRIKGGNVEETIVDDKHALWSFYWKFGVIGLDEFKKEQEEEAKMAAALFIFMYLKGLPASIADKASTAYVHRFFGKITRHTSDGNS